MLGLFLPIAGADLGEDDYDTSPPLGKIRELIETGHYQQAIGELEALATTRPEDADVWNLLGFSRRKLGEHAAALSHYQRALALDPGHLDALEYLGELFVETGEPESARSLLLRLERLCGTQCEQYRDLHTAISAAQ